MIRVVMDEGVVLRVEGTNEPVVVFEPFLDGLDDDEELAVITDPDHGDVAYSTYFVENRVNLSTARTVTYGEWENPDVDED